MEVAAARLAPARFGYWSSGVGGDCARGRRVATTVEAGIHRNQTLPQERTGEPKRRRLLTADAVPRAEQPDFGHAKL